jgi:hypothetical protein
MTKIITKPVEPVITPVEPVAPKITVSGGDDPKSGGSGDKNTVAYETHQKLLDEKKQTDKKLKKFLDEKEAAEKKKLEDDGKVNELLEMEKKTNTNLKESLKKNQLKLLALDFHDPADILSHYDRFEFDAEMNVTNSDEILADLKEKKPYLFRGEGDPKLKTVTTTPKGFYIPKDVDIGKMSLSEYEEYKKKLN